MCVDHRHRFLIQKQQCQLIARSIVARHHSVEWELRLFSVVYEYDEVIDRLQRQIDFLKFGSHIKDLGELFQELPTSFSSETLNQRLKEFRRHYQVLLDTQEDFQEDFHKQSGSIDVDEVLADAHYHCLDEHELVKFRNNVEQLRAKAILIEKLRKDQFEYLNAFDICSSGRNPMTNEAIDALLKRSFSKEDTSVVLWYAGDRLKREQAKKWEEIYQQLISERRKTAQRIKLVYVDYTQCPQRLENFVIVRLPDTRRSDFITGNRSNEN